MQHHIECRFLKALNFSHLSFLPNFALEGKVSYNLVSFMKKVYTVFPSLVPEKKSLIGTKFLVKKGPKRDQKESKKGLPGKFW